MQIPKKLGRLRFVLIWMILLEGKGGYSVRELMDKPKMYMILDDLDIRPGHTYGFSMKDASKYSAIFTKASVS